MGVPAALCGSGRAFRAARWAGRWRYREICSAWKLKGTPAAEQFPGRSASAAIFKAARKFFERPTAAPENFRGLLFARPSPTREAAAGPNAPCGERDASDISLGTRGAAMKSAPKIPPRPRSGRVAANSGKGASRPGEERRFAVKALPNRKLGAHVWNWISLPQPELQAAGS